MYYGIIFSVDADKDAVDDDIYQPVPTEPEGTWYKSEDDETEYECWPENEGWHYKWCACLSQEQMDQFMEKMCFTSICDTMGSLGAPQPDGDICLGMSPAFAVETDDSDAMVQAYVTPYLMEEGDEDTIPELKLGEREGPKQLRDDDWKTIMDWFAKKYGIE